MDIGSSQNNGINVNSSNWSTGTGVIDDHNGLIQSVNEIKTAHGADLAATAAELGLEGISTAIDTVAFVLNPLAKLISAGLGWLVEHVGVFTKLLDLVAGDPTAIKAMADSLHSTAADLQNAATDMGSTLKSDITNWTGAAADAFDKTMTGHQDNITAVGNAVDVVGYVVETTMALISGLRNLIRDVIRSTIADNISTFLVPVAAAVPTAGASLVAAMGWLGAQISMVATSAAAKFAATVAFFGRSAGRLGQIEHAIDEAHPTGIGHDIPEPRRTTPPRPPTLPRPIRIRPTRPKPQRRRAMIL